MLVVDGSWLLALEVGQITQGPGSRSEMRAIYERPSKEDR